MGRNRHCISCDQCLTGNRSHLEQLGVRDIEKGTMIGGAADINRDDITAKPYRSINLERAIAQLLEGTTSDQQAPQLNQQVRLGHVDAAESAIDHISDRINESFYNNRNF